MDFFLYSVRNASNDPRVWYICKNAYLYIHLKPIHCYSIPHSVVFIFQVPITQLRITQKSNETDVPSINARIGSVHPPTSTQLHAININLATTSRL